MIWRVTTRPVHLNYPASAVIFIYLSSVRGVRRCRLGDIIGKRYLRYSTLGNQRVSRLELERVHDRLDHPIRPVRQRSRPPPRLVDFVEPAIGVEFSLSLIAATVGHARHVEQCVAEHN